MVRGSLKCGGTELHHILEAELGSSNLPLSLWTLRIGYHTTRYIYESSVLGFLGFIKKSVRIFFLLRIRQFGFKSI